MPTMGLEPKTSSSPITYMGEEVPFEIELIRNTTDILNCHIFPSKLQMSSLIKSLNAFKSQTKVDSKCNTSRQLLTKEKTDLCILHWQIGSQYTQEI